MVPFVAVGLGAALLGLAAVVDRRNRRRRRQGSDGWADPAEARAHQVRREGYDSDRYFTGSDGGG